MRCLVFVFIMSLGLFSGVLQAVQTRSQAAAASEIPATAVAANSAVPAATDIPYPQVAEAWYFIKDFGITAWYASLDYNQKNADMTTQDLGAFYIVTTALRFLIFYRVLNPLERQYNQERSNLVRAALSTAETESSYFRRVRALDITRRLIAYAHSNIKPGNTLVDRYTKEVADIGDQAYVHAPTEAVLRLLVKDTWTFLSPTLYLPYLTSFIGTVLFQKKTARDFAQPFRKSPQLWISSLIFWDLLQQNIGTSIKTTLASLVPNYSFEYRPFSACSACYMGTNILGDGGPAKGALYLALKSLFAEGTATAPVTPPVKDEN